MKRVYTLLLALTSSTFAFACDDKDSAQFRDTIIISVDENVLQKVPLGDNAQYDSSNATMRVVVQQSNNCDIHVSIWYNSLYYMLTLPSDLRSYGDVIHLRIWTPKVKKKKPSVCSYGAKAGPLAVAGYGVVIRGEPNR